MAFEGSPPRTLGELRRLFEQVLQQSGRLLVSLEADQQSAGEEWEDRRIDEFETLVGTSTTAADAVRQLALGARSDLTKISAAADDLANQVLRRAWHDVHRDGITMVESVAQFATSVAALSAHSPDPSGLQAVAGELSTSIEQVIDAIQAADAARLSLSVDSNLLPALARTDGQLAGAAGA